MVKIQKLLDTDELLTRWDLNTNELGNFIEQNGPYTTQWRDPMAKAKNIRTKKRGEQHDN